MTSPKNMEVLVKVPFNMEVYGLAHEKQKVGGILGLDDHGEESEVPEECKGRKKDLEDPNDGVTFISFARVM